MGGDEEAESRQQEAGRGDVDEGEAIVRERRRKRKRQEQERQERGGGTAPTFIALAALGEGPCRIETSSPESGALIGPDPSHGPPTLAGNHLTSFPARPSQTVNIFRSDPTT